MKKQEPTIGDVLECVDTLTGRFDTLTGRFDTLTGRFDTLTGRFDTLTKDVHALTDTVTTLVTAVADFAETTEHRFNNIESEITGVKSDVTSIKATMVTKEYLDRKIADSRADVVGKIRSVDEKDSVLVQTLQKKKVISASERDGIIAMSPFPRLAA